MSCETWNHIHLSVWLFDTYLLKLWEQRLCVFPLHSEKCPHSVSQIMTSLTSKQSILIKVLVQGRATFHRQQSDGVDGLTWDRQHYIRLWLLRYSLDVNHSAYLVSILGAYLILDISDVSQYQLAAHIIMQLEMCTLWITWVGLNVNFYLLGNDNNTLIN